MLVQFATKRNKHRVLISENRRKIFAKERSIQLARGRTSHGYTRDRMEAGIFQRQRVCPEVRSKARPSDERRAREDARASPRLEMPLHLYQSVRIRLRRGTNYQPPCVVIKERFEKRDARNSAGIRSFEYTDGQKLLFILRSVAEGRNISSTGTITR